jgi:hypothetical protein
MPPLKIMLALELLHDAAMKVEKSGKGSAS